MKLVVLRPEPGAWVTMARAAALGLTAVARPLFRIESLAWAVPNTTDFDALLLTSANTVRQAGDGLARLKRLPVLAVGEATAAAARAAGLRVETVGTGGVAALLAEVPAERRLLHLAGEDRIGVERAGILAVPVYRSVAIEPAPALAAEAPAVLLVHSPRAGRRVAELVADRERFAIAAISPAAAAACGDGWHTLAAADTPDDGTLLSLAARLCQQSPPT
ncbi:MULTISPECIES: uroporphyrinogen-III synthase [Sphingomonas]|uniref:uroporphyrinogen-III synthase n=1 Tax=Sphingomonas TaxID=13687 RepID=UPI000DEF1377|nr:MULTISPECIES: uroporphyrinogen-III synthase [Sphingomonas]